MIDPASRERMVVRRIGIIAVTQEALAELLGIPPGHQIISVTQDESSGVVHVKAEGPMMPLAYPRQVPYCLGGVIERTEGGGHRCTIHGLVDR